jgi:hypothetical protein
MEGLEWKDGRFLGFDKLNPQSGGMEGWGFNLPFFHRNRSGRRVLVE